MVLDRISKVESTHHFDVAEQTVAGVLAVTSIFLASLTFLSNVSFQTQSSGDLGGVVLNTAGEASCCRHPDHFFLPLPAQIVEKKLNLIHKFNSLSTVDLAIIW